MECFHCGSPFDPKEGICPGCNTDLKGADLEIAYCGEEVKRLKAIKLPEPDLMYKAVLEFARRLKAGEEEPDPWDVVKSVQNNSSEKGKPND